MVGIKIPKNNNLAVKPNTRGRPKGALNKTTAAFKDAIIAVYGDLQNESGAENGHFLAWAKENQTEFYKLASKLIPIQSDVTVDAIISAPNVKSLTPEQLKALEAIGAIAT